jgi:flagellar protein FliT
MSASLIDCYRSIEQSSQRMLDAALVEDWERVAQFEGVCAMLIGRLRERARTDELLPEERREKGRIMCAILRNDAQIRDLAEPWLDEMSTKSNSQPGQYLH